MASSPCVDLPSGGRQRQGMPQVQRSGPAVPGGRGRPLLATRDVVGGTGPPCTAEGLRPTPQPLLAGVRAWPSWRRDWQVAQEGLAKKSCCACGVARVQEGPACFGRLAPGVAAEAGARAGRKPTHTATCWLPHDFFLCPGSVTSSRPQAAPPGAAACGGTGDSQQCQATDEPALKCACTLRPAIRPSSCPNASCCCLCV